MRDERGDAEREKNRKREERGIEREER